VNLPEEVQKSEYTEHLKLSKWSEKVAGLDIILKCAGEKPYKLVQPSSAANYAPLIAEIKGFLPHTHFAVVTKALDVLAMMAEGVGEKLYPNLRPLLPKLFSLSKDKKLTRPVTSCLDAFFGNVLSFDHILDADSAIPQATSEKTERNALVRSTTLDFLVRCVARGSKAGPRGALTASTAKLAAQVAAEKLGDSDASVRTAALEVLKELLKIEDLALKRTVQPVIDGLEASNPRAFKQLGKVSVPPATVGIPRPAPSGSPTSTLASSATTLSRDPLAKHSTKTSVEAPTVARPEKTALKPLLSPLLSVPSDVPDNTSIDEATDYVSSLGIPQWDAEADDGGILAGMLCTYKSSRLSEFGKYFLLLPIVFHFL
jgi:cytoskeleton-associated protein 5